MPVVRPAIHPKPECGTALVRELRVAASAAGHGRGRVGSTRDQKGRVVFSPSPFSVASEEGSAEIYQYSGNSLRWKLTSLSRRV